jgi:hypothetical protein
MTWPAGRGAAGWRWRWRAAPGGGVWWRRSGPPGWRRIWPSPPTPGRPGSQVSGQDRSQRRPAVAGPAGGRGAAGELDPTPRRAGVAGAGVAVRVAGHQRTVWCQRIHAELYRHGVAVPEGAIRTAATRSMLAEGDVALSPAGRQRITVGYRMIDATDAEAQPLKQELQRFGARQPACRALADAQYGIGGLIAVAVWSELGDCRRFSRSEQAVRHSGLDVAVDASDRRRAGGMPARPPDAALGAVRGGQEPLAPAQPRPRLLRHGHGPPRRQDRRHLRGPQAGPPLLPRAAQHRARAGLHAPGLNITTGRNGRDRPSPHQEHPRSAPATGVPASVRAGRPSNTDATALPTGGHPIRIVVADDTSFVEHPGNAGRPHAATDRPTTTLHRPSGSSRSYVLAPLRALHP